jgi:hypothetical protein
MTAAAYPDSSRNRGDYDSPHTSPVTPAEDARTILINRISWGAVLAGAATALVAQLVLNMIGIGIGASTLDPGTGDNPSASSFSIGAAIWWALSGVVAAFVGGYMASRLSGAPKESTGGWHGLTSWAVTTLLIFYLLSTAVGSLIGGALNTVSGALGGLGRTAASTAQTAASALTNVADPFTSIEQTIRGSTGNDPAAARDAAIASMKAMMTGDQAQVDQAREQAAQALARAQNISVEEARTRVAAYEQQYRETVEQARQKATQAAAATATAVSRGALIGSLVLLLGALAAWFGGRLGAVEPTITARFRGTRNVGAPSRPS